MNNEHGVFVTLGASNHTVNPRAEYDYYATDPRAVELLLEMETFSDKIWECACGEGHISKVLKQNGYEVLSTDLIDRGYGTGGGGFPYLRLYFRRRHYNKSTIQICNRIRKTRIELNKRRA